MIARALLLLVAWMGITAAIDGLKINSRYSGEPDAVSMSQIQTAGQITPSFVRVTDANVGDAVCLTETWSKDDEKTTSTSLYVPLMDAVQADLLSRGKPVIVNVFTKYANCEKASLGSPVQGILSSDSVDTEVRDKFKESNIIVGEHALLIDPQYAPRSSGSNILILSLSVFAGIAGIVPFFKREKWPKEKDLARLSLPEMLAALHPAFKVPVDTVSRLEGSLQNTEEVILLKVNCVNTSKRPSFAILTNKRYLLYRTNIQFGLILLKILGSLLDKIPVFGGFVGMLVEPFQESYEILLSPEERRFHETMGYEDRDILAGNVPWHKSCEIAVSEIPRRASAITIKKNFWSRGFKVAFMPLSTKGLFRTPSDFIVLQESALFPIRKLIEIWEPALATHNCTVKLEEGKITISWEVSPA
jgi:hypothetical protein